MLDTKYSQPHIPEICLSTLSVNQTINDFGGNHNTSKTTHNISTLNTGETSSNYSVKLSLSPHKSSHGTFLDSLTIDLFKIPDVNQPLKRRHTASAFHTIFFGLVRNQHQFPSCRIVFNSRTYFVRPKTCYCQQQSSQYPIFPSQARDQSFTHVARMRRNTRRYWTQQTLPDVRIVPS